MSEENKNTEITEQEVEKTEEIAVQAAESGDETFTQEIEHKREKREIRISLKTFVLSAVAIILATLMLTYAVCSAIFQKQYAEAYLGSINASTGSPNTNGSTVGEGLSKKEIIDLIIESYFYGEIDKDKMTAESLKAYLASTGDIYAAYYTEEEFSSDTEEGAGRMFGVGINIINSTVKIDGRDYAVLKVINVMKDSPAQEIGLRAGDLIAYAGIGEHRESVDFLGYDEALNKLKGEEGTEATFTVLRKSGDGYEEIEFTATRREVITESVYSRVSTLDPKVGVIKITGFDLTTPVQFCEAVEELKGAGCNKFVMDLRYNPGGYLISIAAVLSYFLDEGDPYIQTEDKRGNVATQYIGEVTKYTGDYATCNVAKSDIGKYKDLNMVVLCNESTASAAELFTATFKDYGIAKVVGDTTYGKGKMQTTYWLKEFGFDGAVKITTHMYYSGGDTERKGYDGVGIEPDVKVALSEEAAEYNIYDLPDDKDDQLVEAIKHFK